jgi:hypothetical protein
MMKSRDHQQLERRKRAKKERRKKSWGLPLLFLFVSFPLGTVTFPDA